MARAQVRTFVVCVIHDSKLPLERARAFLNTSDHVELVDALRRSKFLTGFDTHSEFAFDEQIEPEIRVRKHLHAVSSRPEIPLDYVYDFSIVHRIIILQ